MTLEPLKELERLQIENAELKKKLKQVSWCVNCGGLRCCENPVFEESK